MKQSEIPELKNTTPVENIIRWDYKQIGHSLIKALNLKKG